MKTSQQKSLRHWELIVLEERARRDDRINLPRFVQGLIGFGLLFLMMVVGHAAGL